MHPSRAESIGVQIANHAVRIEMVEIQISKIDGKLDKILWAAVGGLGASVVTLAGYAFKH